MQVLEKEKDVLLDRLYAQRAAVKQNLNESKEMCAETIRELEARLTSIDGQIQAIEARQMKFEMGE